MSDDNDVRSALVEAGEWAERQARLPGPGQARRRSRNRSTTAVAGAAVLTVAALVGAVAGVAQFAAGGPSEPAPAAPTTSIESPSGVPTVIPGDLDLGPDVPAGEEFAGGAVDGLPVDVCPGEGIPGVGSVAHSRYTLVTGPEYAEGRGLLVFPGAGGRGCAHGRWPAVDAALAWPS